MDLHYFQRVRYDMSPYCRPRRPHPGCWCRGRSHRRLAEIALSAKLIHGMEGNPAVLAELSRNVDQAFIVDLNRPLPDFGSPDLVLCLDVLEHLVNPEACCRA